MVEMTHTFFDMDKENQLRVTLMAVKKAKEGPLPFWNKWPGIHVTESRIRVTLA